MHGASEADVEERVKRWGRELGFDAVAIAGTELAEEEARAIVGDAGLEELRGLGVPEVIVTYGLRGSLVLARGVAEHVGAHPVDGDPTGAGDAFSIAYLGARAAGHGPVSAARRATALVASLLAGPVR